jgi:hypothetical protein
MLVIAVSVGGGFFGILMLMKAKPPGQMLPETKMALAKFQILDNCHAPTPVLLSRIIRLRLYSLEQISAKKNQKKFAR